jgi:hydrophobe/amphiphile efflux-1 (HAE1) family protein
MKESFFIRRPIFAAVISIVIMLVGFLAMRNLAIEQSPDITPPTVEIAAAYPGASAEEVARAVATPIENQLAGTEHMLYYSSANNSDGTMSITVTFQVGTNLDVAQVQVQNRVSLATPRLPQAVNQLGVTVKKKSTSILCVPALTSSNPRYDALYLGNYATINFLDALRSIPGVGEATVFGSSDYTMRIVLDPVRMGQLGVVPNDIAAVIREQNNSFPAGLIGREPSHKGNEFTIPVITQSRLTEAGQFEKLIVRSLPDGTTVRLGDVSKITLGGQNYDMEGRLGGKPAVMIPIFLTPGANALATREAVDAYMRSVKLPQDIEYKMAFDTTPYVNASIGEVVHTLVEAMVLVFLVVYLFLQNLRATIIPMITVPVSLIGTFAGMYALGFSVNSLTLFGMVLAIGIVVDDAIVVLENVERHMSEEGLSPRAATQKAMSEITGPVVAIVLVLCAVFVPVGFLGGLTGQLYRQFAITVSMSIVLSGIVALTLCPALCAIILKHQPAPQRGFFAWFNRLFDKFTSGYTGTVRKTLRHAVFTTLIFGALLAATWGIIKKTPTGFIPGEDQGYILAAVNLPTGASKERTTRVIEQVEEYFLKQPEVEDTVAFTGMSFFFNSRGGNVATLFIRLKNWEERKGAGHDADGIAGRAMGALSGIKEAFIIAANPPPIRGLGASAGYAAEIINRKGVPLKEFNASAQGFIGDIAMKKVPGVAGAFTGFNYSAPKVFVNLDRERAKALGVNVDSVFSALQTYFGTTYVNDFYYAGRVFKVQMEGKETSRQSTADFGKIFVRNAGGEMLPLDTFAKSDFTTGPDTVYHFNGYEAIKITGASAPGFSSGQTLDNLEKHAAEKLLPQGLDLLWDDSSYQEKLTGDSSAKVMIFGLVMVFLVLAAQYESWSIPIAVLISIPIGVLGAYLAVFVSGMPADVFFQIGLLTLVGLAAKNAILIVEFANTRVQAGMPLIEAAAEAARLRLRPIVMTSFAFISGILPLVIATGAGAGGRRSVGTGVFGGMLAATLIAIFFIPLFFVLVTKFSHKFFPKKKHEEAPSAHH